MMNEERQKFYLDSMKEYPDDPAKKVGWVNKEALDKRFNLTLKLLGPVYPSTTILDYGCGASLNLYHYLGEPENYIGLDILPEVLQKISRDHPQLPYVTNTELREALAYFNHFLAYEPEFMHVASVKADRIVVQGVFQEFSSIKEVRDKIMDLSGMLANHGRMIIMTPSNLYYSEKYENVLRLSPYDMLSILVDTGMSYTLMQGQLGSHLIAVVDNRKD